MIRRIRSPELILYAAMLGFAACVWALQAVPRVAPDLEMQVAVPIFVQVVMTGGDRNLAADIAVIRALVASNEKMTESEFRVQAKIQSDASLLNPAHEDNYTLAAAILPWNGEIDAAQFILRRASFARPSDPQPGFFYGFNLIHFKHDATAASAWMRAAAERLPEGDDRVTTLYFAARWLDQTDDLQLAVNVVEGMAKQAARRPDFRKHLLQRAERLKGLLALRTAAGRYAERNGHPPGSLAELVTSGFLLGLPVDPLGFGYDIDATGRPVLLNRPKTGS